jgi:energy-coupling factor transporter ATP-binding protein EcfA2
VTLELTSATYRYAGYARPAIHDVDLRLDDGEIVGLVGANDAGKSTICLVASGLAPASIGGGLTGSLVIDGVPMAGRPVHHLAELVAIGFQDPATQRSGIAATVFEEVALGPMNLGLPTHETIARAREALTLLRIGDLADRDPARLSGGQGQLVAIASLLAMRPRHIVLDEPTAQLDPEGTRLVAAALRDLAAAGTALLVVEHRTDVLDGLCGRIAVVADGRIVADGPTAAILEDPRLEAWGVEPPSRVRLARALAAHGLDPELAEGTAHGPDPAPAAPALALDPRPAAHGPDPAPAAHGPDPAPAAPALALDPRAAAVRVVGLVHVYPEGTRALDGIDLEIEQGEVVGQNGSGKSTLALHLDGLLRPTEGTVAILGEDAAALRVAALASRVGLVFQDPDRQIFSRTVRSEVVFGPSNLGRRGTDLDRAVDEALDAVGLTDQAAANPYDLGYSRRRLLAIASVLAMRTPIIVLDEPTTGQDLRGVARVRAIVAGLAAEGRTIIAISHDMRFVAETFGRVVVMRAGRVVLDGTPADVFAESCWPTLESTYLEPPLVARVGARLGVGSTPTEAALVEALAARAG